MQNDIWKFSKAFICSCVVYVLKKKINKNAESKLKGLCLSECIFSLKYKNATWRVVSSAEIHWNVVFWTSSVICKMKEIDSVTIFI